MDAQAFFFDLDDTLVDFGKARRDALQALAGELAARIPRQSADQMRETRARIVEERNRRGRGMPQTGDLGNARIRVWIEVLAFIGAPDLAEPEQLVDDHDKLTRRHLELYPDAEAAIRWAAERFEITGIITNGPSDVQWGEVRAVGLEDRMDRVIVAGDVGAYKPDPRIFQAALEGRWASAARLRLHRQLRRPRRRRRPHRRLVRPLAQPQRRVLSPIAPTTHRHRNQPQRPPRPLRLTRPLRSSYSLAHTLSARIARQFGDQYAAYADETGRWLPRLRRSDP